jgi:hypothetical protein
MPVDLGDPPDTRAANPGKESEGFEEEAFT